MKKTEAIEFNTASYCLALVSMYQTLPITAGYDMHISVAKLSIKCLGKLS